MFIYIHIFEDTIHVEKIFYIGLMNSKIEKIQSCKKHPTSLKISKK